MAMLPPADSATEVPRCPTELPVLTSLSPCCVQTPSLRVSTHAAPAAPRPKGTDRSHGLSPGPPTMAVLPSADNATDTPWRAFPTAPLPTSFLPCCVQVPPLRVNTHAPSAPQPPTMAVLPSAESATDIAWPGGNGGSLAPLPTSLLPCCVQILPLRAKTHAAPVVLLSLGPPMMAVLPSEERATDAPWDHNPPPYSLVVPTSLPPCCVQVPPLRVNTHAAPTGPTTGDRSRSALLGPGPPTIAVLPSADSATDMPWLVLPTAPVPTSFGRCSKDRTRSAFAAARPFGSTESPACHAKYVS